MVHAADNVLDVLGMLQSHSFIKNVILGKSSQPIVALHSVHRPAESPAFVSRVAVTLTAVNIPSSVSTRTFNLRSCYVMVVDFAS